MLNFLGGRANILETRDRVIIIPTNCVGVMGAGLALGILSVYPNLKNKYYEFCRLNSVKSGNVYVIEDSGRLFGMATTKNHWKEDSNYEKVENCIRQCDILAKSVGEQISMPRLGCGLGGLRWPAVRDLMITHLSETDEVFNVYGDKP